MKQLELEVCENADSHRGRKVYDQKIYVTALERGSRDRSPRPRRVEPLPDRIELKICPQKNHRGRMNYHRSRSIPELCRVTFTPSGESPHHHHPHGHMEEVYITQYTHSFEHEIEKPHLVAWKRAFEDGDVAHKDSKLCIVNSPVGSKPGSYPERRRSAPPGSFVFNYDTLDMPEPLHRRSKSLGLSMEDPLDFDQINSPVGSSSGGLLNTNVGESTDGNLRPLANEMITAEKVEQVQSIDSSFWDDSFDIFNVGENYSNSINNDVRNGDVTANGVMTGDDTTDDVTTLRRSEVTSDYVSQNGFSVRCDEHGNDTLSTQDPTQRALSLISTLRSSVKKPDSETFLRSVHQTSRKEPQSKEPSDQDISYRNKVPTGTLSRESPQKVTPRIVSIPRAEFTHHTVRPYEVSPRKSLRQETSSRKNLPQEIVPRKGEPQEDLAKQVEATNQYSNNEEHYQQPRSIMKSLKSVEVSKRSSEHVRSTVYSNNMASSQSHQQPAAEKEEEGYYQRPKLNVKRVEVQHRPSKNGEVCNNDEKFMNKTLGRLTTQEDEPYYQQPTTDVKSAQLTYPRERKESLYQEPKHLTSTKCPLDQGDNKDYKKPLPATPQDQNTSENYYEVPREPSSIKCPLDQRPAERNGDYEQPDGHVYEQIDLPEERIYEQYNYETMKPPQSSFYQQTKSPKEVIYEQPDRSSYENFMVEKRPPNVSTTSPARVDQSDGRISESTAKSRSASLEGELLPQKPEVEILEETPDTGEGPGARKSQDEEFSQPSIYSKASRSKASQSNASLARFSSFSSEVSYKRRLTSAWIEQQRMNFRRAVSREPSLRRTKSVEFHKERAPSEDAADYHLKHSKSELSFEQLSSMYNPFEDKYFEPNPNKHPAKVVNASPSQVFTRAKSLEPKDRKIKGLPQVNTSAKISKDSFKTPPEQQGVKHENLETEQQNLSMEVNLSKQDVESSEPRREISTSNRKPKLRPKSADVSGFDMKTYDDEARNVSMEETRHDKMDTRENDTSRRPRVRPKSADVSGFDVSSYNDGPTLKHSKSEVSVDQLKAMYDPYDAWFSPDSALQNENQSDTRHVDARLDEVVHGRTHSEPESQLDRFRNGRKQPDPELRKVKVGKVEAESAKSITKLDSQSVLVLNVVEAAQPKNPKLQRNPARKSTGSIVSVTARKLGNERQRTMADSRDVQRDSIGRDHAMDRTSQDGKPIERLRARYIIGGERSSVRYLSKSTDELTSNENAMKKETLTQQEAQPAGRTVKAPKKDGGLRNFFGKLRRSKSEPNLDKNFNILDIDTDHGGKKRNSQKLEDDQEDFHETSPGNSQDRSQHKSGMKSWSFYPNFKNFKKNFSKSKQNKAEGSSDGAGVDSGQSGRDVAKREEFLENSAVSEREIKRENVELAETQAGVLRPQNVELQTSNAPTSSQRVDTVKAKHSYTTQEPRSVGHVEQRPPLKEKESKPTSPTGPVTSPRSARRFFSAGNRITPVTVTEVTGEQNVGFNEGRTTSNVAQGNGSDLERITTEKVIDERERITSNSNDVILHSSSPLATAVDAQNLLHKSVDQDARITQETTTGNTGQGSMEIENNSKLGRTVVRRSGEAGWKKSASKEGQKNKSSRGTTSKEKEEKHEFGAKIKGFITKVLPQKDKQPAKEEIATEEIPGKTKIEELEQSPDDRKNPTTAVSGTAATPRRTAFVVKHLGESDTETTKASEEEGTKELNQSTERQNSYSSKVKHMGNSHTVKIDRSLEHLSVKQTNVDKRFSTLTSNERGAMQRNFDGNGSGKMDFKSRDTRKAPQDEMITKTAVLNNVEAFDSVFDFFEKAFDEESKDDKDEVLSRPGKLGRPVELGRPQNSLVSRNGTTYPENTFGVASCRKISVDNEAHREPSLEDPSRDMDQVKYVEKVMVSVHRGASAVERLVQDYTDTSSIASDLYSFPVRKHSQHGRRSSGHLDVKRNAKVAVTREMAKKDLGNGATGGKSSSPVSQPWQHVRSGSGEDNAMTFITRGQKLPRFTPEKTQVVNMSEGWGNVIEEFVIKNTAETTSTLKEERTNVSGRIQLHEEGMSVENTPRQLQPEDSSTPIQDDYTGNRTKFIQDDSSNSLSALPAAAAGSHTLSPNVVDKTDGNKSFNTEETKTFSRSRTAAKAAGSVVSKAQSSSSTSNNLVKTTEMKPPSPSNLFPHTKVQTKTFSSNFEEQQRQSIGRTITSVTHQNGTSASSKITRPKSLLCKDSKKNTTVGSAFSEKSTEDDVSKQNDKPKPPPVLPKPKRNKGKEISAVNNGEVQHEVNFQPRKPVGFQDVQNNNHSFVDFQSFQKDLNGNTMKGEQMMFHSSQHFQTSGTLHEKFVSSKVVTSTESRDVSSGVTTSKKGKQRKHRGTTASETSEDLAVRLQRLLCEDDSMSEPEDSSVAHEISSAVYSFSEDSEFDRNLINQRSLERAKNIPATAKIPRGPHVSMDESSDEEVFRRNTKLNYKMHSKTL